MGEAHAGMDIGDEGVGVGVGAGVGKAGTVVDAGGVSGMGIGVGEGFSDFGAEGSISRGP